MCDLLKCGGPARIYMLKSMDSPSRCYRQLPIAPQLGVGLPIHLQSSCWSSPLGWGGTCCHKCSKIKGVAVHCVQKTLSPCSHSSPPAPTSFFPLFLVISQFWEECKCICRMCLFRAEHSSFSYFLHLDQLLFFELIAINWKKRFICWGLRDVLWA